MSYFGSIYQNVLVSAANSSSTATLAGNGSWIGTSQSTLNVAGIQVTLKTSVNSMVYVDQSGGPVLQTGSVTTNGTVNLVGSGTTFTNYNVGDEILVSGETSRVIASITDATHLAVTVACSTSASGLSFQTYNWDISDSFLYNSITNNFSVTVQSVNSYVRVRVTNSTSSASTYFRLQTCLCPIIDAIPRAPDSYGNLKVSVNSINDSYGNIANCTSANELRVAHTFRLTGSAFAGVNNSNFWVLSNNGTGASATENQYGTCTSGTSNNGYAQIQSRLVARYIPGIVNRYESIVLVTNTTVAGCTRRWGCFTTTGTPPTPVDGFYFELSPAGVLSLVSCAGGTPTPLASGTWNGIINGFTMDTNQHSYRVQYMRSKIEFRIDNNLAHTLKATTTEFSNTLHLPVTSTSVNSASGTASGVLQVWESSIERLGEANGSPNYIHISGNAANYLAKTGPGKLFTISINNGSGSGVTVYDGVDNTGVIVGVFGGNNSYVGAYNINLTFSTGLYMVVAGNGLDCTVIYE